MIEEQNIKEERITKTLINDITGEVETRDFYSKSKSDLISNKRYGIIYNDFFEQALNLSGSEYKILFWLILNSNKSNFIKITYKSISKKIGLSLQRTKEIMAKLQKLNFVKNVGGIIYINPYFYSKAKSKTGQLQLDLMPLFKEKGE